ncbi:glycosyltransferase family 2 protein [Marinomonas mediterranea]|jgi:Glycosyltransferases involved in cell wall biogenesis|uniref:Glycosyl transferase family 2 n=1 Tax=Marinomonas mediterranea (strain ATCC 700492 / JCM 21426 / NBRC 103028 / MMB-1) TaxID=717774 RepID=F2K457_MARM1|nr:glycosyltransferase family 2 protein [Marinomonas mediterranea]ADZ92498.1 glycosyl transferase family 2 [Marinomonas mediterranea MMB-1]WCN10444.1 glycosyltransferase [Marinomonas mediterranea]WCN14492.1 glycosyltransferase [Marinomonas mediterranea]WCN18543.1 glycosyltransferase [Marinomonas mediterranea MMB-1]
MKVSLIVTTYNWKEALAVTLNSVLSQKVMPFEVIVADDGSREDTKKVVDSFISKFSIPLIHSWQEDTGFRLAASRNKAIAKASGDYLVIVDGDMYLPPRFIESHIINAKKGHFVQGGRVLLGEDVSEKLLENGRRPTIFSKGIRNRHNMIDSSILSRIFTKVKNNDRSTRGCNFALWREDAIRVNGYNEDFEGWGREDSEMVVRLLNSNISRLYLKFKAVGYHIYHVENSREQLQVNNDIYMKTLSEKLIFCNNGISQYL